MIDVPFAIFILLLVLMLGWAFVADARRRNRRMLGERADKTETKRL
ncbi:MAG TPA: hypothetical protein VL331_10030 [Croceibacterium sp.]|jgi:hypothetical protein|nr:hypothetical protein [Croceibacterium sp.]